VIILGSGQAPAAEKQLVHREDVWFHGSDDGAGAAKWIAHRFAVASVCALPGLIRGLVVIGSDLGRVRDAAFQRQHGVAMVHGQVGEIGNAPGGFGDPGADASAPIAKASETL
jgi:hypothetical protein